MGRSKTLRQKLLGGLLASQGRCDEAIERLSAARDLTPEDPKVHYNLAFALSVAGQNDAAEVAYQAALRLQPDYMDALKGLAAIRQRSKDASLQTESQ